MPRPAHRQPPAGGARSPHQPGDLLLRPRPGDAGRLAPDDTAKVASDTRQGITVRPDHPGTSHSRPPARPAGQLHGGIVAALPASTQPEPPPNPSGHADRR